MNNRLRNGPCGNAGFSLIELLIVVSIIGIIAAIAVPQLMDAMDRGRQRRSMADMRSISTANSVHRLDLGSYAATLAALATQGYMQAAPLNDAWGNAFVYTTGADTFTLTSNGSDGAPGPAAPNPWVNAPYDPDIIMTLNQFVQSPTSQ